MKNGYSQVRERLGQSTVLTESAQLDLLVQNSQEYRAMLQNVEQKVNSDQLYVEQLKDVNNQLNKQRVVAKSFKRVDKLENDVRALTSELIALKSRPVNPLFIETKDNNVIETDIELNDAKISQSLMEKELSYIRSENCRLRKQYDQLNQIHLTVVDDFERLQVQHQNLLEVATAVNSDTSQPDHINTQTYESTIDQLKIDLYNAHSTLNLQKLDNQELRKNFNKLMRQLQESQNVLKQTTEQKLVIIQENEKQQAKLLEKIKVLSESVHKQNVLEEKYQELQNSFQKQLQINNQLLVKQNNPVTVKDQSEEVKMLKKQIIELKNNESKLNIQLQNTQEEQIKYDTKIQQLQNEINEKSNVIQQKENIYINEQEEKQRIQQQLQHQVSMMNNYISQQSTKQEQYDKLNQNYNLLMDQNNRLNDQYNKSLEKVESIQMKQSQYQLNNCFSKYAVEDQLS
ncbi:Hypothetical_protein [Hexamita inflata]|uniref:Hypothetical_protein n=1 Tax=Hexamita inflata TaxID=28002 RepID=A0ABP1GJ61_9EUKA